VIHVFGRKRLDQEEFYRLISNIVRHIPWIKNRDKIEGC